MKTTRFLMALAVLTACDFDITDPNNPSPIGNDPSPAEVGSAAIGIILAARADAADWILDAGIIGREAYRFDGSLCRHFRQTVSRSRGNVLFSVRGERGSSWSTW